MDLRVSLQLLFRIWLITQPKNRRIAQLYWNALLYLYHQDIEKYLWYPRSFYQQKTDGSFRPITPGSQDLVFAQYMITEWLLENYPHSDDYCYTGQSVYGAVSVHRESSYGFAIDLKDAFGTVTPEMVARSLLMRSPAPLLSARAAEMLADICTLRGSLPQGCVSSPYVFNVVALELDACLAQLASEHGVRIVRYADDICVSSEMPVDDQMFELVCRCIEENGFRLNREKVRWFKDGSIKFLGLHVGAGKVDLTEETMTSYVHQLVDAIAHIHEENRLRHVAGLLARVRAVYGDAIPIELAKLFNSYYVLLRKEPPEYIRKRLVEESFVGRLV